MFQLIHNVLAYVTRTLRHRIAGSGMRLGTGPLAVTALMFSATAHADDRQPWDTVGDWSVYVDAEAGNGCYIERIEDETVKIRLGYLPLEAGAFISVASTEWGDLSPNNILKVRLLFDDVMYAGDTETFTDGNFSGGYSFFNSPLFLSDFTKRSTMTIIDPDGVKNEVNLKGTAKAVTKMQECQEKQAL